MSDAAVFALVSGLIQITTIVVGFLMLWVKLKYGVEEAKESADKAEVSATSAERRSKVVEEKIDVNTKLTKVSVVAATKAANKTDEIASKTDEIAHQLNGDTETKIHTVVREYLDTLMVEQSKGTKEILVALSQLQNQIKAAK